MGLILFVLGLVLGGSVGALGMYLLLIGSSRYCDKGDYPSWMYDKDSH